MSKFGDEFLKAVRRFYKVSDKPSVKILDRDDYRPEELHWEFSPCPYGIKVVCEGKYLSFGFFNGDDLIKNLVEGLPKMKAAIERGKSGNKEDKMNAREKAIKALRDWPSDGSHDGEVKVIASIIEAVKEDMSTPGKEFDHLWEYDIPKPCDLCTPADHGKIILVDKLGEGFTRFSYNRWVTLWDNLSLL